VDLLERQLELGQVALLAATQAELEGLQVLAGGQVHLVRQIARIKDHVVGQRLLGVVDNGLAFGLEELLELLELLLVQRVRHGCLSLSGWSSSAQRAQEHRDLSAGFQATSAPATDICAREGRQNEAIRALTLVG